MSLRAELKQIIYDLPLAAEPGRDEIAHFCNHQGIRIKFTRARTTWHSLGPSAIKPWWMILEPLRTRPARTGKLERDTRNTNNNNKAVEVTENA